MRRNVFSFVIALVLLIVFTSGCSQPGNPAAGSSTPAGPSSPADDTAVQTRTITPGDLAGRVGEAVAYARENGRDKAMAAFNDPQGSFARDGIYVFAEDYTGLALAEPFEPEIVGTNIGNMTDRFGVPLVRNLQETARYGIGYVSYDYKDPATGRTAPKLSVVADVDGTYYAGAGAYAGTGMIYPSSALGPASRDYNVAEMKAFVQGAVAYAREHGKEEAFLAFNTKNGRFADGELTIIAVDYNGTMLASSISTETARQRINLINYHDPDGVATIREMRDLALHGGGFSYTVAAVTKDGMTSYAPKIDYAEPVDTTYWVFSGIIVPGYEQVREGNLTGIRVRDHTRAELYDLVDRAVAYAKANGKERTLAEINNPDGQFAGSDLFVWAEDFNGTILADPYWKEGVGKNWMDYTDPYGAETTIVNINAVRSGGGFTHTMFPETSGSGRTPVPKLVYARAVDDTWWIGSGIYGIETG